MNGVTFCLVGIPPRSENEAKGRNDGVLSSNENTRSLSSGEVEGVAWQGPRTVLLQKNSQGFGFTLRHFIVYPPESSLHNNLKDEENGNGNGKGCQRGRLEPMDTIFVKSVREKSPAHQAGLCTGDRLVKVNGESVLGKTYSQVIALIQNSENVLELCIMPKDEDVLQLAYSQDAYLRGNEPYTGGAQHIPDPPPLCYPRAKPAATAPLPPNHQSPLDNWHCRPSPVNPASPLDNRSAAGNVAQTSGRPRGPGENEEDGGGHFGSSAGQEGDWRPSLGQNRGRSSSAVSALDFHFANHNAAIASATLPHMPARKGSLPAARAHSDAMCHQALSDWYYSQAEAAERMSPRHRSISQDRLAELGLGLALGPGGAGGSGSNSMSSIAHRDHGVSQEALQLHHQAAAASHDSYWLGGWGGVSGPGSRSCSESLLAAYASYERSYGRSQETLAQAAALVSPHYERAPAWPSQGAKEQDKDLGNHHTVTATTAATLATAPSVGRQTQQQQVAEPQTQSRRLEEEELVGYKSYSPSFCRKAGHLLQQAHSFREPTYIGPHLNWAPSAKTSPSDCEGGLIGGGMVVPRPSSTPAIIPSSSEDERARLGEERGESKETLSPLPLGQEVVLRQKPPMGRRTPVHALRHPLYALPVDSSEPPIGLLPSSSTSTAGTPSPVCGGTRMGDSLRRPNGSLQPQYSTPDSLASIPFIDDPISPSADLRARHVPACSVVSSSPCPLVSSLPCALTSSATTVSPVALSSSTSPLVKLRSQDSSSIKSRRSSYLLAITTERSKSCDEGLNTFREEGRVFSRLPKRVKSFFTDGSLESLRAAEEARSKRHSTSELGTITFSDVRKDGWLHYKQILTEKGKKVGGGMRPWKRVFSVLRSHCLLLYKDKREAVLHGAGAGPGHGEDEHPPISIRGCLIDIAYSETKRKHALRLTTQDFCEYLLQAENREDMLGWIRVIRENSKTDNEELGFSRQALISKKLNDYRKQTTTGNKPDTSPRAHRMMPPFLLAKTDNAFMNRSSSKDESKGPWGIIMKKAKKTGPKVFGVRLEDCQPAVNNKFVPLIVELCCGLVESMGLEYTGVYRVPGNNAMVSNLQEQLNKGLEINITEERWQDLNVISSLLKSFFRKLPEPLFTDDKYNDFIDANRLEDSGNRLKSMKKLIHDLPDHYHHTLKFLVCHLKTVADHADKNKMEPRNLALVFGPTLVRTSEDNMTDMVTHMPDRYKIIETLILHHDWFFSDGEVDKDEKAPVDIKRDMQPVPNIDHLLSNIGRTGLPGSEASDSTTSDSPKDKCTWGARDLSARDFLPLSIISAVTRKRKIRPISRPLSSSTDEDSEHEPIKASNYGVGGGAKEEEEEGVGKGCTPNGTEKVEKKGEEECRKRIEAKQESDRGREKEGERKKEGSAWVKDKEVASPKPHPNSFLYTHYQPTTTSPSPPVEPSVSPHSKLPSLARGRSAVPSWLSPSRQPGPSRPYNTQKTQQPQLEQQPLPVQYRKTRGVRARPQSMNLDMVMGKGDGEGGVGRRGDRVKVVRATTEVQRHRSSSVGVPQGCVVASLKVQGSSRLASALAPSPVSSLSPPLPSSSFSPAWTDQGSLGSTVVMRRSALEPRDKRKAWRRHTVVV